MLFEVIGPDGKGKMCTHSESCIPYEDLDSMAKAGYSFRLDGKKVSKNQLLSSQVVSGESRGAAPKETRGQFVIRCIETNETFNRQCDAAKALNIDPAQVSDSIKTGRPRSGYTFVKEEVG